MNNTENTIYSAWAFTSNENEKSRSNQQALNELKGKYTIQDKHTYNRMSQEEQEQIDIVYGLVGRGYAETVYEVYKNRPNLTNDELALICDNGNLCFGYHAKHNMITIYID